MPANKDIFNNSVFINCPFDKKYKPLLNAILFTTVYCGFYPRIASESSDSLNVRLLKIRDLIKESRFSVHDLSRMEAKRKGEFARFNMPFELGLDFGCRVYGGKVVSKKQCLIFDKERYRYQKALSDLAGVDIRAHNDDPEELVHQLRHWIRNTLKRKVKSGTVIWRQFVIFMGDYKRILEEEGYRKRDIDNMEVTEFIDFIKVWMQGLSSQ